MKTTTDIYKREEICVDILDALEYDDLSEADIVKICMCYDTLAKTLIRISDYPHIDGSKKFELADEKYRLLLKKSGA